MSYDVFDHTDEWRDGYDAGIQAERSTFVGYLISNGVLAPDKRASALYDPQQSDLVRRTILDYVDNVSTRGGKR